MSQIAAQDARTNQKTEIVLIGHSMGTIVLNELIRRFPTHNYTHIVYMAAACTIKDFVDAVPDYVTHNESVKFYSLCLHPSADAGEITAWGTVPNGSLLEWLDAYVLGPRTQMHRTLGKWNNAVPMVPLLNDLPPRVRNAIHMKGFTVLEDKYPCTHGSFDDYRFWHQDFWNPQHLQPVETVEQVLARVRGG